MSVFILAVVLLAGHPARLACQTGPERAVALTFDDLPANTPRGAPAYGEILDSIAAT